MSNKTSLLNSQSVFFGGIIFTLLLFLVATIIIFTQFFRSGTQNNVQVDNSKDIYLENNFIVKKVNTSETIDYNFEI